MFVQKCEIGGIFNVCLNVEVITLSCLKKFRYYDVWWNWKVDEIWNDTHALSFLAFGDTRHLPILLLLKLDYCCIGFGLFEQLAKL